jgi:ribosomal protein S18 acetylase RimI-like enzyme
MKLRVRRVAAADWREMKRIRLAALAADRMAFGSTLEAEAAFADEVWIDRARQSATSAARATWVAFAEDGRMVGMMGAHVADGTASLFGSWVEPAARGAGAGGQLLDALIRGSPLREPRVRTQRSLQADRTRAAGALRRDDPSSLTAHGHSRGEPRGFSVAAARGRLRGRREQIGASGRASCAVRRGSRHSRAHEGSRPPARGLRASPGFRVVWLRAQRRRWSWIDGPGWIEWLGR